MAQGVDLCAHRGMKQLAILVHKGQRKPGDAYRYSIGIVPEIRVDYRLETEATIVGKFWGDVYAARGTTRGTSVLLTSSPKRSQSGCESVRCGVVGLIHESSATAVGTHNLRIGSALGEDVSTAGSTQPRRK